MSHRHLLSLYHWCLQSLIARGLCHEDLVGYFVITSDLVLVFVVLWVYGDPAFVIDFCKIVIFPPRQCYWLQESTHTLHWPLMVSSLSVVGLRRIIGIP